MSVLQGVQTGTTTAAVCFTVRPPRLPEFRFPLRALVLRTLTTPIPVRNLSNCAWSHLNGLQLANACFANSARVDVLLGVDVYGHLLKDGLRRAAPDIPSAQLCLFVLLFLLFSFCYNSFLVYVPRGPLVLLYE